MAKENVYTEADIIQFALDKKWFKEWNEASQYFHNRIGLGYELTRIRMYYNEIFEEDEEEDKEFDRRINEFMDSENIDELIFI